MDSSSAHGVSIYNIQKRKRIFDSRTFVAALPAGATRTLLRSSHLEAPALSPDGMNMVCVARPDDGNSVVEDHAEDGRYPATHIVHFDLKRKSAEILLSLDAPYPVGSIAPRMDEHNNAALLRVSAGGFAWHPTRKKFVFVGMVSYKPGRLNLFTFDLQTKKMSRLTTGEEWDFSPRWSLDGKQIYWIHGNLNVPKVSQNQIFRADADGSNATPTLPQLRGVTRIQLLPKIADWSRYRKLSIEPLAGKDK